MYIAFLAWQGSVHTRRWVEYFARRGHEVHVITCGDGSSWDMAPGEVTAPPYVVHDVGAPRFGKLGYFLKVRQVRKVLRELKPDLVHAHFVTSYGMLGLMGGVRPLVLTAHGDDVLVSPKKSWLIRKLVTRALRAASIITVPSEPMRSAVIELLGKDQTDAGFPIAVFQYGVETAKLAQRGDQLRKAREERPDHAELDRPIRVVSTRAFLALYRIELVLEAIALLHSTGTPLLCDLVGDGPLAAHLKRRSTELKLDDIVTFHGQLPPWEAEDLVGTADVYVSVSESDGVSLSLLEALALGPVPVLSNIPANQTWIEDGVSGILVEPTAEALASAIAKAASLDQEAAARINRATVEARADRAVNLGACELLLDELVGVIWEPAS